jgi:hypothetical protein
VPSWKLIRLNMESGCLPAQAKKLRRETLLFDLDHPAPGAIPACWALYFRYAG